MQEQSLKEKTSKGLLWGGIGNGIQQILNLIFGIFLARLLSPADYGMVGMLTIFSALANTFQESGFIVALANKKNISHEDYNAVFWFNVLVGVSFYVVFYFCAPFIAAYYRQPELIPLSRYIFLGFVISSFSTAQSAYLFKNMMVKQKAISQFPALTISGAAGIIMAYNGMSYWGIATQNIIYISIINICFWYFSPWRPSLNINFKPIKKMFGFSSRILATNLLIQINNNIFPIILGRLFLAKDVGLYTQSNKWTYMGSSLTSGMISSVAQPILTEVSVDKKRQEMVFRKIFRFTSYISFPLMFGLALIAHEFIKITITEKWLPCVPILQILCIWGAFTPISTLYSNLIISKGRSDIYMWNTLFIIILQIAVLLITYKAGIITMVFCCTIVNIMWLSVWQYFTKKAIGMRFIDAIKDMSPYIITSLATMVITYFITIQIENDIFRLILKILIAAFIYITTLWLADSKIQQEVIRNIYGILNKRFTKQV